MKYNDLPGVNCLVTKGFLAFIFSFCFLLKEGLSFNRYSVIRIMMTGWG